MKLLAVLLAAAFLGSFSAVAANPVNTSVIRGLAIKGYDPVSYFTAGKAQKGSKDLEFKWKGATWRFVSAEHRELFKSDPEKFAPQYGGYCALVVSRGELADIDPDAWAIVNDKLYLDYDRKTHNRWLRDRDENIKKADKNWPELMKE